jgi:FtsP/CotA-like multicopper oxidase with cupredoxin domain
MSDLVPGVNPYTISSNPFYNESEPVSLGKSPSNLYRWNLNSTSMHVAWENPTLLEIYRNHTSFTNTDGVVHLHGHDFVVLSQGSGTYTAGDITTNNPPRRDTAMLPADGHLVIGFKTDNPGAWLTHCHIGWHTAEGFALQFVEQYSKIQDLIDYNSLHSNCQSWETYQSGKDAATEDDSGV